MVPFGHKTGPLQGLLILLIRLLESSSWFFKEEGTIVVRWQEIGLSWRWPWLVSPEELESAA